MKLFVFLAVVAVCYAMPRVELNEEWEMFKQVHAKSYEQHEEPLRRLIWEDNVKFIQDHNLKADRGVHTYWLGVNQLADMTTEEILMRNGYRFSNSTNNPIYLAPNNFQAPDEVDWRKEGYVTSIKDQGHCGSCWSFSTTGSLEGQHFKKTGKLVSLSEQNLVDCSKKFGNHGCEGGLMDNAFRYIKSNGGIDTEESYPYTAKDGRTCKFNPANVGATDTGYTDIRRGSESDLMSAVGSVGPISVAIDASKKTFHFYKSGVYVDHECSSTRLDHGVLAVGYGSENEQDYWLVKNSWGTVWGMQGYIMMARNHDNMCGIATAASYPLV